MGVVVGEQGAKPLEGPGGFRGTQACERVAGVLEGAHVLERGGAVAPEVDRFLNLGETDVAKAGASEDPFRECLVAERERIGRMLNAGREIVGRKLITTARAGDLRDLRDLRSAADESARVGVGARMVGAAAMALDELVPV